MRKVPQLAYALAFGARYPRFNQNCSRFSPFGNRFLNRRRSRQICDFKQLVSRRLLRPLPDGAVDDVPGLERRAADTAFNIHTVAIKTKQANKKCPAGHFLLGEQHLCLAENFLQLHFCRLKNSPLLAAQIFAGAVDVKIKHRHRRLVSRAFAARAFLGRTLQGQRNPPRIFPGKNAALKVKCKTVFGHIAGPVFLRSCPRHIFNNYAYLTKITNIAII